jgi:hypothetical protein
VTFALEADQLNVVPATRFGFDMTIAVVSPEQTIWFVAAADGSGLTVTIRLIGRPLHPLKVGVILYVTVPEALPVFTGESVIMPDPLAVTEAGLIVPVVELVHEKVVPEMLAVGVNDNA